MTKPADAQPVRAALYLDRLYLSSATFNQEFIPASSEDAPTPDRDFDFAVGVRLGEPLDDDLASIFVDLTVEIEPDLDKDQPYRVEVSYIGEFSMDEGAPWSDPESAQANCVAILFPYVRQLVSDLTSRGTNGALHLPTMNVAATLAQSDSEATSQGRKKKSRKGGKGKKANHEAAHT